MDSLENRLLLSAAIAPRVTSAVADNRGEIIFTLNQPLRPATVTPKSVRLFRGAKRLKADIAYIRTQRQIVATARAMRPDSTYTVRLVSSIIKGKNGKALDGEYNGPNRKSGNRRPGGDFVATTAAPAAKIARFTTSLGTLDVRLFTSQTPITVQNFLAYANSGRWDGTFFHRSVPGFVIQGGGFAVASAGQIVEVAKDPPIVNEPHPGDPGNIRGTIAMAKGVPGEADSATNQWFFNLDDNRLNLDAQDGGMTVFGQMADTTSIARVVRLHLGISSPPHLAFA